LTSLNVHLREILFSSDENSPSKGKRATNLTLQEQYLALHLITSKYQYHQHEVLFVCLLLSLASERWCGSSYCR
jgi:hypothetical protein